MSRRFRLASTVAILSTLACSTAFGQSHPSAQASVVQVEGSVRSAGGAIAGAVVVLEQAKGGHPAGETKTDTAGNFTLSADRAGTYIVHAEKPGFQADSQPVTLAAGEKKHIDLTLQSAGEADPASAGGSQGSGNAASASSKSSAAVSAMEFADTPNFTVAGVTDYSNVGLHGSDARVRTSEALNKETLALKSANAGGGGPDGSGESSAKNKESAETESKLRAALAQSPKSFDANHQLGEFCLRSKRYKEAIPPLEAAYRVDPGNKANAYDLARAYEGSGDLARARDQALSIPVNADTHRLLGDLDERLGDPVAAAHEYEQAAQSDPSEQNYFDWGAELLLHKAALPAVEVFSKGSAVHPKSARMVAGLGAALYASGSYDDAARRLCDASDLDPADPAPYLLLGKMEMGTPSPLDCSEERLARFARDQPENASANYYYAMDLWKRDRASEKPGGLQQPQALLEKAVALDPKFGEAYVQLGILYAEQKQEQQAIAAYKKATAVSPELGDAHYRLSLAYKRSGEEAKAREEMQTYEQIEKTENAAMERERRELRQFLIILKDKAAASP